MLDFGGNFVMLIYCGGVYLISDVCYKKYSFDDMKDCNFSVLNDVMVNWVVMI